MNKKDILNKLSKLKLDKDKYIIISGASLVLQNIINSTNDIDLSSDSLYYDSIDWNTKIGYFKTDIKYYDCFEIGKDFYNENYISLYGYKVQDLYSVYKLKLLENKSKDKETINKLEKILKIN